VFVKVPRVTVKTVALRISVSVAARCATAVDMEKTLAKAINKNLALGRFIVDSDHIWVRCLGTALVSFYLAAPA
jgi:hypothetical protein